MKKLISMGLLMLAVLPVLAQKQKPATVIITAGQSNTDGRELNEQLPEYIKQNGYKYCQWSYGGSNATPVSGSFEPFYPRIINKNKPGRWAYDAVTYYWMEQALKEKFYVIKTSLGGTAIDTACASTSKKYWFADPVWLKENSSVLRGGHSLLLSFTENIDACIDQTLSKLKEGYEIKAFLWHQGESDRKAGKRYYQNLKEVVAYVRQHLVEKTGKKEYARLPFICGTVSRYNKCFNSEVEEAMYRLAKEDKNFYVIDMAKGELQRDQLHFTAPAAEYLGIQMYDRLVKLGVAGKHAPKAQAAYSMKE